MSRLYDDLSAAAGTNNELKFRRAYARVQVGYRRLFPDGARFWEWVGVIQSVGTVEQTSSGMPVSGERCELSVPAAVGEGWGYWTTFRLSNVDDRTGSLTAPSGVLGELSQGDTIQFTARVRWLVPQPRIPAHMNMAAVVSELPSSAIALYLMVESAERRGISPELIAFNDRVSRRIGLLDRTTKDFGAATEAREDVRMVPREKWRKALEEDSDLSASLRAEAINWERPEPPRPPPHPVWEKYDPYDYIKDSIWVKQQRELHGDWYEWNEEPIGFHETTPPPEIDSARTACVEEQAWIQEWSHHPWDDPNEDVATRAESVAAGQMGRARRLREDFQRLRAALVTAESPAPNRPPRSGEVVSVRGTLTSEGTQCPALRDERGALYTLHTFSKAIESFHAGDRVCVRGRVPEYSYDCSQQGITLEIQWIRPASAFP